MIRRMIVEAVERPLESARKTIAIDASWTILLTDDGAGVARALRETLSRRGAQVALLSESPSGPGSFRCAFASHDEVRRAVEEARRRLGPLRGLIHLPGLTGERAPERLDREGWMRALQRDVKSFFFLAKELRDDLVSFGARGSLLAASTWLGGSFGLPRRRAASTAEAVSKGGSRPSDGGVGGLAKALSHELSKVLVKVVDLASPSSAEAAGEAAELILREIEYGGRRVEVGYARAVRFVPTVTGRPVDPSGDAGMRLDGSKTLVLFGGARGITAEIAKDLARRFQPQLVLIGSTELPSDVARIASLDEEDLKQLRRDLAGQLQAGGGRGSPAEVKTRFAPIGRAIEAYRNLREMEQTGAKVRYRSCDVRDGQAVAAVMKEAAGKRGRIDGVVFAAGRIEDRRIEDKDSESFDRVFGVKAEGVFNVFRALGAPPEFFVIFSSVAGRFGNAGQTDYAAGNDLLAKFAIHLQALGPKTRCVTIDWTAWSGVGLAARPGMLEMMNQRGFELLSPERGVEMFREELLHGADTPEVVIAGGLGGLDRDGIVEPV